MSEEVFDDPRTYDGRSREVWMDGLKEMDKNNMRHLLILFAYLGIPESFLDVGCGTGVMVRLAQKLGVRSYGLDQLVEPDWGKGFVHMNLVDFWQAPEPVDIVWCVEVAEHIHESAHSTLCDTIAKNLKEGPGHYVIFSAARPGQVGAGHVACRPASYWHNEMILRGIGYDREATMNLALLFSNCKSNLDYLWDNLICFQR